jgi:hypothetical protein
MKEKEFSYSGNKVIFLPMSSFNRGIVNLLNEIKLEFMIKGKIFPINKIAHIQRNT